MRLKLSFFNADSGEFELPIWEIPDFLLPELRNLIILGGKPFEIINIRHPELGKDTHDISAIETERIITIFPAE